MNQTPDFEIARQGVRVMVYEAIRHEVHAPMLVIADAESPLARTLTEAYVAECPWAELWRWEGEGASAETVRRKFHSLPKGTLVVLVQSTNFRIDAFRIRLELFSLGLKTIEHVHLGRMKLAEEQERYLASLHFGPQYFTTQAKAIAQNLKTANKIIVTSQNGSLLTWEGGVEDPKLNIGDYSAMQNVGGTFPIGEVFTEAKTLECVNGDVEIFAMANDRFEMERFEPFTLHIERGQVVLHGNEPKIFTDVYNTIIASERALVRELGFGLNPAFGPDRSVADVTAFERQKGLHLSLGEKHSVYPKEGVQKRGHTRFHVDVFVRVAEVLADSSVIYKNGDYLSGYTRSG